MNNFKIGDNVILVDARDCHTAELNKSYIVSRIRHNSYTGYTSIALEENESNDKELIYLDSRRFKFDIKLVRKNKLKEIFKNYEL